MPSDSGRVVAAEVQRILQAAANAGSIETLTRRIVTESVAKNLGKGEDELKEHRAIIKDTIEKFMSENDNDEPAPSEDGKRKSSPDVESEIPAKKAKLNTHTETKASLPTTENGPAVPEQRPSKTDQEEEAMKSESELSVLIDEPPKRKKGVRKSKGESGKMPRKSKEQEPLSKNEETIKKYKALITACGVRKQWAKELEHCETDSRKVSHLKRVLADLGMTGRMSMEQAKAIRERRELQQEIEDVVKFERSKGVNSTSRGRHANENDGPNEESGGSDDEPSAAPPVKKKPSAARSIMAFLGAQSESEGEGA